MLLIHNRLNKQHQLLIFLWASRFNVCYCLILFWLLVSLLLLFSFKIKITNRIFHISPFITHFFYIPTSWLNFQMKSWINMSFVNDLINSHHLSIIFQSSSHMIGLFDISSFCICLFLDGNSSFSLKLLFSCFYQLQLS